MSQPEPQRREVAADDRAVRARRRPDLRSGPGPGGDRITAAKARLEATSVELDLTANGAGTAQVFLWTGDTGYIPVWKTSCDPATDPAPDYGLSACSVADGDTPPWSPDMSGRVVAKREDVALGNGVTHITLPLTAAQREAVSKDGRVLVSFETPQNEVQALDVPLDGPAGPPAQGDKPPGDKAPGGPAHAARRMSAAATRSSAPPRPTA